MKIQDHILYKNYTSKFDELKSCIQDEIHHGEGDVFTHTQMVMDALYSDGDFLGMDEYSKKVLEYSVMLHDIEKPKTRLVEENPVTHKKHARYGSETALKFLTEMGEDINFIYDVVNLVLYHGKPFWVSNKENSYFEVIRLSFNTRNDLLYIFAKADLKGRICDDYDTISENLEYFKMYAQETNCFNKQFSFITLMDKLNYFRTNDKFAYPMIPDLFDYKVKIMVGVPASGKSTYIKENLSDYYLISTDNIREKLNVGLDKKSQSIIFEEIYKEFSKCCREHADFVFDATNIRYDLRKKVIDYIMGRKDGKAEIEIIWVRNKLSNCLKNNKARNRTIDEKYLLKSYYGLQIPTATETHKFKIIDNG